MNEQDKEQIKDLSTAEKLEKAFEKEREKITSYIQLNIISKMNNIDEIADVQVHILSQRQKLVDKASEMRASIKNKKKKIDASRKQKYRFYKIEYDIKLNDYEIKNHIEADLAETNGIISQIENQITFYKESTDTLDKCIYMIKYLIETKKYLSGSF